MKNVYLFQPNDVMNRKHLVYPFPYSVGILWTYATTMPGITDHFRAADFIFAKDPFDDVINNIVDPDVCAFSCYIWNKNYCKELATKIKKLWPDCLVVFGGPDVDEKSFIDLDFVDVIVIDQGEIAFADILTKRMNGEEIPRVVQGQKIDDLSLIPSPYTNGLFDHLFEKYPNYLWAMTMETSRGCPYSCTFCNWGFGTGAKLRRYTEEQVYKELDWTLNKPVIFLVMTDPNFGILKDRDINIAKYIAATADKPESNINQVLAFASTKNSPEMVIELSNILRKYITGVYVSKQSMHDDTLKSVKRFNMKVNDAKLMLRLARENDLPAVTEFILGLPNETLESWKDGLTEIIEYGQHANMAIYIAMVLPNTEFSTPEYREQYGITTVDFTNTFIKPVPEIITLVNGTNTMSTVEIAKAMHYGILIMTGHLSKIAQYQARYCRDQYDIPYRSFYDALDNKLRFSNRTIGDVYRTGLEDLIRWYTEGYTMHSEDDIFPSSIIQDQMMKKLVAEVDDFLFYVEEVMKDFGVVLDEDHATFFKNVYYNPNYNYPMTVNLNFNISDHELTNNPTTYYIEGRNEVDLRSGEYGFNLVGDTPYNRRYMTNNIVKQDL